MQQCAVQALTEDEYAIVGPPLRGPSALVPGGRTHKVKLMQTALRRLAQNLIYQQLPRTMAAKSFVISGFGQKIPATQIETKMPGDWLAIQFQKIQRQIAIVRRGLRHAVIELARAWIALDGSAFRTLPAGGFQVIKLFERRRIGFAVMLQLQRALLFQLALCPP